MDPKEKADNDNHSNQLNPNNDEFYNSRGEKKPEEEVEDDRYRLSDDDDESYDIDFSNDYDDGFISDFD